MEGKGDNSQGGQAERMWVSDTGGGGGEGGGSPQIMSSDPRACRSELWKPLSGNPSNPTVGSLVHSYVIEACLYPFINTERI